MQKKLEANEAENAELKKKLADAEAKAKAEADKKPEADKKSDEAENAEILEIWSIIMKTWLVDKWLRNLAKTTKHNLEEITEVVF